MTHLLARFVYLKWENDAFVPEMIPPSAVDVVGEGIMSEAHNIVHIPKKTDKHCVEPIDAMAEASATNRRLNHEALSSPMAFVLNIVLSRT